MSCEESPQPPDKKKRKAQYRCCCNWSNCKDLWLEIGEKAPSDHVWNGSCFRISVGTLKAHAMISSVQTHLRKGEAAFKPSQKSVFVARHHFSQALLKKTGPTSQRTLPISFTIANAIDTAEKLGSRHCAPQNLFENNLSGWNDPIPQKEKDDWFGAYLQAPLTTDDEVEHFLSQFRIGTPTKNTLPHPLQPPSLKRPEKLSSKRNILGITSPFLSADKVCKMLKSALLRTRNMVIESFVQRGAGGKVFETVTQKHKDSPTRRLDPNVFCEVEQRFLGDVQVMECGRLLTTFSHQYPDVHQLNIQPDPLFKDECPIVLKVCDGGGSHECCKLFVLVGSIHTKSQHAEEEWKESEFPLPHFGLFAGGCCSSEDEDIPEDDEEDQLCSGKMGAIPPYYKAAGTSLKNHAEHLDLRSPPDDVVVPGHLCLLDDRLQKFVELAALPPRFEKGTAQEGQGDIEKAASLFERFLRGGGKEAKTTELFPGPYHEGEWCMPFAGVLLEQLCGIQVDEDAKRSDSAQSGSKKPPGKPSLAGQKRVFEQTTTAPKPDKTDFRIQTQSHSFTIERDDGLELFVALKPAHKTDHLLSKSRDEALSHLANRVVEGMSFYGLGIDSQATAVVLSLADVEILRMSVVSAGTDKCKLHLESTGPLPLLSRQNFEKWFRSDGNASAEKLDRNEKAETCTVPQDGPSPGLQALWATLHKQKEELCGPNFSNHCDWLGNHIYNGEFSDVLASKRGNSVIKLTKYDGRGAKNRLKNEAVALRDLGQVASEDEHTPNGCRHIPFLVDVVCCGDCDDSDAHQDEKNEYEVGGVLHKLTQVHFSSGDVLFKFPALVLSPRGHSLKRAMFKLPDQEFSRQLNLVFDQVKEALDFVHSKGWLHNDVSDENIIISKGAAEHGQPCAILIDFEMATRVGETMPFRGTYAYVHKEVRDNDKACKHETKHDLAAFGFTMALAFISKRGKVPPYTLPDSRHSSFNQRQEWSQTAIDQRTAPKRSYGPVGSMRHRPTGLDRCGIDQPMSVMHAQIKLHQRNKSKVCNRNVRFNEKAKNCDYAIQA